MPNDEKDDDLIWPHGEHEAEPEKLLEAVKELADEATKKQITEVEAQAARARKIASSNGDVGLSDMPESVLDGRLGEICNTYMLLGKRFPLAYAWPALLAVASTLAPRHHERQKLNLFVALAGPVHTGKSQTIKAAQKLLG